MSGGVVEVLVGTLSSIVSLERFISSRAFLLGHGSYGQDTCDDTRGLLGFQRPHRVLFSQLTF